MSSTEKKYSFFFLRLNFEKIRKNKYERKKNHISAPTSAIFNACSVFTDIVAHDAHKPFAFAENILVCNSFSVPFLSLSFFVLISKLIHFSFVCLDCNKFAVGVILVFLFASSSYGTTPNIKNNGQRKMNGIFHVCARVCAFEGTFFVVRLSFYYLFPLAIVF